MSVHLHVRSCYTLLQSTLTSPKIVAAAKRCGYTAVALTDKHVMHGAMAFYHACKKENIKPIFGMEVDVLEQEELYGFVVLAKNDAGYQNLLKLSTWLNKMCIRDSFCDAKGRSVWKLLWTVRSRKNRFC